MKERCIGAVSVAVGRNITKAEADGIESAIVKHMRFAARSDPAKFNALSPDDRLRIAAKGAAKELIEEAELKKKRVHLTIQAKDRLDTFISDAKATGMAGLEAVKRTLVSVADGKSNTLSVEARGNAMRANYTRQLIDTFHAVDAKFFGLFESKEGVRILTKALFGEKTGVAQADAGAKAFHDVAEQMRAKFNDLGGKTGQLSGWAIPQHHSQLRVSKAGRDAWVDETFGLLDRRKYVNPDGSMMDDAQVREHLSNAWTTIATGGINQYKPGAQGQSMLANRRSEHREVHFKDADSYLAYQSKYGEKSLWGVIVNHVDAISKELASLEAYGPNPDRMFQLVLEEQLKASAMAEPAKTGAHEGQAGRLSDLYDFTTGKVAPVANERMAQFFDTLRNWLVAARLGSAVITSFSDEATVHLTAKVNNLPEVELLKNELATLNIANRTEENLAHRAGLGLDILINQLNRWGADNLGPTFSSKLASTIVRASGLEALDGARRRAFGVTYMSALGEMAGKYSTLEQIDPSDHRILLSKGITEADWQVWRLAELEKWGAGNGVLTPEAIGKINPTKLAPLVAAEKARIEAEKQAKISELDNDRGLTPGQHAQAVKDWTKTFDEQISRAGDTMQQNAVLRLLGLILEETDIAIIRPGASDRFITGAGMQRGTLKGELTRSFFLFKAFPMAMISRHWMRAAGMETNAGKAAYIASLVAATTVGGVISQTINDLLQGKDIRNYNPFAGKDGVKNTLAAFLKGGSLGLYGDFLFSGTTNTNFNGPIAATLGPVAGLVEDAFHLTQGNLLDAAKGKDMHFGAEATRFVKGNLPGASLWYAKAGLDHMIFHRLQEYFSPGYLAKTERRTKQDFGQEFWWPPGTGVGGMKPIHPERALGR